MSNTDVQSILEVLVEHIENGTREAPQEEERRDENEWDKIFLVRQSEKLFLLFPLLLLGMDTYFNLIFLHNGK